MKDHATSGLTFWGLLGIVMLLLILLALAFPGLGSKDAGHRAQAGTDAQAIVSGLKAYITEYGCLPGESGPEAPSAKCDRIVGDPAAGIAGAPNNAVFDILRAIPSPANPDNIYNQRKIIFVEARSVQDSKHPRGGFVDDPNAPPALKGCYFDPWGHQYCVVLDTNHDGRIDLSPIYQDFSGESAPSVRVGAFSLGPDGLPGKKGNHLFRDGYDKSDDIVSWSN